MTMSERDAVSVLVTPDGDEQRVLLVERSPKLRFFGGFLAFPGGTLDPEDASVEVANKEHLPEIPSPLVVAAARELFEETGLWAASGDSPPPPDVVDREREAMLAGRLSYCEILRRHDQRVDAAAFSLLGRMKTPPFAPVRYDTWFLHYRSNNPERVRIIDGELVSGRFEAPAELLERWSKGLVPVAPPMVVLLREWTRGGTEARHEIRTLCDRYAAGELHRIYFTPGILLVPLATPTRPPATHTNTLIVGERQLYLVDPAPVDTAEQRRLFCLLDRLLEEERSLEAILLTHYHPDHVGAVKASAARYHVPVWAHSKTAELVPELSVSRRLGRGDALPLGEAPDGSRDWSLQVFHVPGHAPGHLAFKESRYGALVVGDLVSTLSSILVDPRDGHLATYLRSLESLLPLASGAVYPGHGPPVLGGRRLLEKQLKHRASRESQLLNALAGGAQTADELVGKIYDDVPERMLSLAKRSLLSGLVKLEEEGRVLAEGQTYELARPTPDA